MSCTISTREMDGAVIFDIAGRMSFPDPHLKLKLDELIENGRRGFIINLDKVTYIDSYGLHDLVMTYNTIKAVNGKIHLLKPNPNVRKTIEITLKTLFTLFDEEAAAIQSVQAPEETP